MNRVVQLLVGAAVLASSGCVDDTTSAAARTERVDPMYGKAPEPPMTTPRYLAVLGGDYKSTALSLLDLASLPDEDVTRAPARATQVLHSGSRLGATAATLSGDVVLAQAQLANRNALLIDRATGVLTVVNPTTRTVERQVSAATGFYANPQDVAIRADGLWLVSRMARNPVPTPTPTDLDEGDDLLLIDPQMAKPIARLALTPYADAAVPQAVAAPQRMETLAGTVWLPLASFAPDFKVVGTAKLVAVDPLQLQVTREFSLQPWRNCVSVRAITTQRLLIGCQGGFQSGAQQATESALLVVDVSGSTPAIVQAIQTDNATGPWSRDAVAVDERWAVAVTLGDFATQRADSVWRVDLQTGARDLLTKAAEPFGCSGLWADSARRTVWLGQPHRSSGDLWRWRVDATGKFVAGAPVQSNPGGLGALEIGGL